MLAAMPLPADLLPLPPGLLAVTGDERTGKTTLLRRLAGDLPADGPLHAVPGALWLDPALPGRDQETAQAVWDALRAAQPGWDADLLEDLAEALDLQPHRHKQLFMLSAGSRRKVALAGLLAAGAPVTCLDQPYAAVDQRSVGVLREVLADAAAHPARSWVVADYEADPQLPWARVVALD